MPRLSRTPQQGPILIAALLLIASCAEAPTSVDQSVAPGFAKGGPNQSPPVNAHVAWDDALVVTIDGAPVPAGIRGDGRMADGTPGFSAVQGGLCGVKALISTKSSETGDLYFDEGASTGCGALRTHAFYLDGSASIPWVVATKTIARALWKMGPGEVRDDLFEGFHVGQSSCGHIYFDRQYAGSSNPKRTRLPDLANGARQWRVESQLPHRGMCVWTTGKKDYRALAGPLPWAFTVTEVK